MPTPIVKLVGFLVANLCHDEKEWKEWAVPFIELLLSAQRYSKSEKNTTMKELDEMFLTLFGTSTKLVCEEGDGFILLHVGDHWWQKVCGQDQLEDELSSFLNNYISWTSEEGAYDARARVIAKRMFFMLQSGEKFTELENRIQNSSKDSIGKHTDGNGTSQESGGGGKLNTEESSDVIMSNSELFPHKDVKQDRMRNFSSEVTGGNITERVWKVSLAATVGASLMSVAAISTGPAIVSCLVTMMGESSMAQFFLGMTALFTSYGVTSMNVMGTLGAYSATMKMLHRTEPLQEFRISHLERRSEVFSDVTIANGSHSSAHCNRTDKLESEVDRKAVVTPMYILVPGHCNYIPASEHSAIGISDAVAIAESLTGSFHVQSDRDVWGADPTVMADMEIIETADSSGAATQPTTTMLGKVNTIIDYFNPTDTTSCKKSPDELSKLSGAERKGGEESDSEIPISNVNPPGVSPSGGLIPPPPKVEFIFEHKDRYNAYDHDDSDSVDRSQPSVATKECGKPKSILKKPDPDSSWDFVAYEHAQHGWWKDSVRFGDEYLLQWDRSTRDQLSRSLHEYISKKGIHYLTHELLMLTPAASLLTAAALPWPLNYLKKSLNDIDNPWSIAIEKSRKAGRLLAITLLMQHECLENQRALQKKERKGKIQGEVSYFSKVVASHVPPTPTASEHAKSIQTQLQEVLMNQKDVQAAFEFITMQESLDGSNENEGDTVGANSDSNDRKPARRPITLVGYGIGARVIVHCLETLVTEYKCYSNKDFIRGLIENVVLMGTPYGTNSTAWRELRSIVPGRFVNCYSTRDWLLALMFRQCTWELGVAGLSPIDLGAGSVVEHPAGTVSLAEEAVNKVKQVLHPESTQSPETVDKTLVESADTPYQTNIGTSSAASIPSGSAPVPPASARRQEEPTLDDPHGIENIDITPLIRSHADYPNALQLIIPLLRLEE